MIAHGPRDSIGCCSRCGALDGQPCRQDSPMAPADVRNMLSLVDSGCVLVSSATCSLEDIAFAKATQRFFVSEHGHGYVAKMPACAGTG